MFLAEADPQSGIWWIFSWKDYWFASVSAVIGAIIGIRWAKSQFRQQKENEKRRSVARLRESLQFNLDRLNQAWQ